MCPAKVSIQKCKEYEIDEVRRAVKESLIPLGGMRRYVQPGMHVLLKPNLLAVNTPEQAVTTHPVVVQAVAELVKEADGEVWIGDSPNSSVKDDGLDNLWHKTGMAEVARVTGATLIPFQGVTWKRLHDTDYMIARQALEADLVINLPKLKTHSQTLYTGAIKNLFGVIPGARKTALHIQAPGMKDFSRALVDVLSLVRPGLTLMDGVTGMEGNGPGTSGTPRAYGCIGASTDPVALDAVITRAMGYRQGEVLHIVQAGERSLGEADPALIEVLGSREALNFGHLQLPISRWYFNIPSWLSAPVANQIKLRPKVDAGKCSGCGTCTQVCPAGVIKNGKPPNFSLDKCIGCMCCAESCPEGAITPKRSWVASLVGVQ